MGTGIAAVVSAAGFDVEVVERDAAVRARLSERLGGRPGIVVSADIPARADAVAAIEAVPERMDIKRDVVAALLERLPSAIVATGTSSLSIEEIAAGLEGAERVLGMHFFNPPATVALVEVIAAAQTSDETLERAYQLVSRFGKTAVAARDTPGFIVNRVARPFYLQALHALEQQLASAAELDDLARGIGFRMGPFALMDLIGLDVDLAISMSIFERTDAQRLAPVAVQADMVRAGMLGKKSGRGFYSYPDGAPGHESLAAAPADERNGDERVVVVGFGATADAFYDALSLAYVSVERVENDELLEDDLDRDATIVVDIGDGWNDREAVVRRLDALLAPEAAILVDAYATDLDACAKRCAHPERLSGYGILGAFERQHVVEIADGEYAGDDTLALAEELFEAIGKRVVLVGDHPGLFLGRLVCSIVNEALVAVDESVASPDDVDAAMQLGAGYPLGPLAWGREIGAKRVQRVLSRLAAAEGAQFAPFRSTWLLDVDPDEPHEGEEEGQPGAPNSPF